MLNRKKEIFINVGTTAECKMESKRAGDKECEDQSRNLREIVTNCLPEIKAGNFKTLESEFLARNITISEQELPQLKEALYGQDYRTLIGVHAALIDAHLRRFQYTRDRFDELSRLAETYKRNYPGELVSALF